MRVSQSVASQESVVAFYIRDVCRRYGVDVSDHEIARIIATVQRQEREAGLVPRVSAVAHYLRTQYCHYGAFQFLADLEARSLAA